MMVMMSVAGPEVPSGLVTGGPKPLPGSTAGRTTLHPVLAELGPWKVRFKTVGGRLTGKPMLQPDALMVPETALGSGQLGKYVYVVGADKKAEQRLVTLGPADGDLVSVQGGVAEGDQIITGNLQKIGPGAPVQPLLPKQASAKTM